VLEQRRGKDEVRAELQSTLAPFKTEEKRLDLLRVFKRRELLHIGVRDILRLATVEETLTALSELAEVLIHAAYEVSDDALRGAPAGEARPAGERSGYVVVGLGKLGGGELNFSSDVDLLYVYSSDKGRAPGTNLDRPDHYAGLSRRITAALGTPTGEGYVFRVDLRLRPEGRIGSLAHSLAGLYRYYKSRGRTWERLALLKAWPVAGDLGLGARLLRTVAPFVYGGPFGPEAFAEVRRLRAQIAKKIDGRGEALTNVKLGTGGIREIEFVTQALQARHGRQQLSLRQRGTMAALSALREAGRLPPADHDVLAAAYVFLRDVENKLQMVSDAQVHALPSDPLLLRSLARTLGYGEGDTAGDPVTDFQSDYRRHTGGVHDVFTRVFDAGATPPAR
jgi:glutamate-ammonia-ligase adenylyltransferase